MKRISSFLFAGAVSIAACCGQRLPEIDSVAQGKSLLWEVIVPKQASPSYILGTMHILCPEDAILSPEIQSVFDYVEKVYFEVDLDDMGQMINAMKAMFMKDGVTLKDLLTDTEFEKVESYFKAQAPLPFSMLQRFKPLLLSSMVAEQQLPCNATNGMELMIMKQVAAKHKPILGLETMAYQAGLFDSIPYELQAKELLKAIDSIAVSSSQVDSLLDAYRAQDLEKIERLAVEGESGLEGNLDLLLYQRNRNWVQQMDTIFTNGPVLIAVGAAHLPGEQGVIALLKRKGYILRPLKNNMVPNKKSL